jgi:hypothetical protein
MNKTQFEPHFDKLSHVLNELITIGEKVSNIEIVLGSMPKFYTNLVIAQMGQVGIFYETLNLLFEEETKKNAKMYKGDNENFTLYGGSRRVEPSLNRPKRPNIFQFRNPNWKRITKIQTMD